MKVEVESYWIYRVLFFYKMKKQHIDWWQSLTGSQRFPLMKKYNIKSVNDKLIKRMWRGEKDEH